MAEVIQRAFWELFSRFGVPVELVVDCEGAFVVEVLKTLWADLGIKVTYVTPFCHYQNLAESRFHRIVTRLISLMYCIVRKYRLS